MSIVGVLGQQTVAGRVSIQRSFLIRGLHVDALVLQLQQLFLQSLILANNKKLCYSYSATIKER